MSVPGGRRVMVNTRKLHRRIANGTAKITSATVKREAGRWYVSFCVQVDKQDRQPARPDAVIGVDLGVRTLAVFSDGRPPIDNPRHYDTARRKLGRCSRTVSRRVGPDPRTGQQPSHRWQRADQQRNKVHHRVASLLREGIHQLTTSLAREYGTIVVEDLHVSGMVKNRALARVVSDAGFGEIRRQLTYKTAWNGGGVVVADRWFPSSKTCSGCGAVRTKLPLRTRTFVCDECGLVLDRDENAALNLAALVERQVAGSGPETRNGRGADHKTVPGPAGGCETSTSHRTFRGSDQARTFVQ
ncbi:MAG: RNA-guided endonuclease TnpB family protein [Umezawaea sp.]